MSIHTCIYIYRCICVCTCCLTHILNSMYVHSCSADVHMYIYTTSQIFVILCHQLPTHIHTPYEPTYIYNIKLLYIGAQHPYHTQLCSIDTRRYHRTSVLTAVGCVHRDPNQIFILVYAVYNNTCYTDIVDIQQPTYATIASSIYNNIHVYLYT